MVTNSKEYMTEWRKNNREKTREYAKRHIVKHGRRELSEEEKEKQKEYMHYYRQANKDHLHAMKKLQIANNPEYAISLKRSKEEWRQNNKWYPSFYNRKKRKEDLNFKLRMSLRTTLWRYLKENKTTSALILVGCSIEEFKNYIASNFKEGMIWDNHGEWELDHIKPLALFNLVNIQEQKEAFHFTNFQPLWKIENRTKRDNYEIQSRTES